MFGDIDFYGADFVAGAAEAAGLREVLEFFQALEEGCDECADGAGVDAAVGVASDFAIDGAGIQTCAAADAA